MMYRIGIVMCMLALLSGCGSQGRDAAGRQPLVGPDAATLLDAAEHTLSRMHFTLDKYDVEAGYLRTRPLRGGQFFELWRRDNASAEAFAQANVDSLRRTVEVFTEPEGGTMHLRCRVSVEKLSVPAGPVRGASHLAGLHTAGNRGMQTLMLTSERAGQVEWIDLGYDAALEERILEAIARRLGKES